MTDFKAFARDLVADMERDLATRLDWVAVEHWNTDNPHVHLLVRGTAADDRDLVISRDYLTRGMRARAEDLSRRNSARKTDWKSNPRSNATSRRSDGPGSTGRLPAKPTKPAWSTFALHRLTRLTPKSAA